MLIRLFINHSEANRIRKDLTDSVYLQGNLREETSIISPVILIEAADISGYNYAYIPEFDRYYFIEDITSVRTGLWRLRMTVDVLQSFADDILNLRCIIDKQQGGNSNLYLDQGDWVVENKSFNRIYNFPEGFNENGEFILICAGG